MVWAGGVFGDGVTVCLTVDRGGGDEGELGLGEGGEEVACSLEEDVAIGVDATATRGGAGENVSGGSFLREGAEFFEIGEVDAVVSVFS